MRKGNNVEKTGLSGFGCAHYFGDIDVVVPFDCEGGALSLPRLLFDE